MKHLFLKKISIFPMLLLGLWGCGSQETVHKVLNDPNQVVSVDGTTISPVITSKRQFDDSLLYLNPQLRLALSQAPAPNTYVIPGLQQTKTIVTGTNDTIGTSYSMDPQGLAITPDYLIISAYSHDKKYNSVLYFLDKQTGGYIKQIVLPNNSHVGGLGFDTVRNRLWITTETASGHASLSAYDRNTLTKANFSTSHKPTPFDYVVDLPAIKRASFMTYYNNNLYVGYFDVRSHGSFLTFPLNKKGLPEIKTSSKTTLRGQDIYPESYQTEKKLQGVTFYKDKIIFSQSFGPHASHLILFENDGQPTWRDFDADDTLQKIKVPPYLEQIVADKDNLYLIFESASARFLKEPIEFHADRILKLNIKTLLK